MAPDSIDADQRAAVKAAQVGWGSFRPSRPGIKFASRGEIVESALDVLFLPWRDPSVADRENRLPGVAPRSRLGSAKPPGPAKPPGSPQPNLWGRQHCIGGCFEVTRRSFQGLKSLLLILVLPEDQG